MTPMPNGTTPNGADTTDTVHKAVANTYPPETIAIRRRSVARQLRATQDRLRSIEGMDLFSSLEPDLQFLDEKELQTLAKLRETTAKITKHLGALSRRLETTS